MLETKDLVKIYRPKKGVPVKALDGVSIKFPDTGMVFLLGKSGCGKSTLLNLLGGLDKYDKGEIIIKGVSSKKFNQAHFDSYRNTYVGFIFQEYNILDEFTVGANIALALELQGKKATDEEINRILQEVDLAGYGSRNPNELSGGQKQRVAIARALVKNPKIIMADEPSGALDSATGKQVFDTLKKLSKEKLVIVVSHDRDFAYEYADRIIELADGQVLSDTTLCESESAPERAPVGVTFDGATAKIPMDYRLTEEDRVAINEYLEHLQSGAELEFVQQTESKKFTPTEPDSIKNSDNSPFKLIKSKLSLKHAFKIGASGLKFKKFRLVMTILLSCVAFILFGLVDTFSAYNHIDACTDSVYDSNVTYASLAKSVRYSTDDDGYYWVNWGKKLSQEELDQLKADTGIDFNGVLSYNEVGSDFETHFDRTKLYELDNYGPNMYLSHFSGIVEITESEVSSLGYTLIAGTLPDGSKKELAISKYCCETFFLAGYRKSSDDKYIEITDCSEMVGKTLPVGGTEYTITGVIDTNLDWDRYKSLLVENKGDNNAEIILEFALFSEFSSAVDDNYAGMAMLGEGGLDTFLENRVYTNGNTGHVEFSEPVRELFIYPTYLSRLEDIDSDSIDWLDGVERVELKKNEIVVSLGLVSEYLHTEYDPESDKTTYDVKALSELELQAELYSYNNNENTTEDNIKIVGVLNDGGTSKGSAVINDTLFDRYVAGDYDGDFDKALGAMPESKSDIKKLVTYCYNEDDDVRYEMQNPACFELDALNELIKILANVFLYVGIGFAIFASILLSNFIATSVSYKKQEIGILRAIGSRGNDVFRIFFAEAFIIAMINFVITVFATGGIVGLINSSLRTEVGLLVTVLNFGIRQYVLLFVISIAVAAIASFLPVKKIASKRPIDAIKSI